MELDKDLNLTTVIFDLDGTLHFLPVDYEALRAPLGIADTDEKVGDAIQRLMLAHDPRVEAVTEAELQSVAGQTLAEPIVHTLQKLHEHHFKLAIFTRNSRQVAEQLLQATPCKDEVFIIGREDAKNLKPHREGIDLILEHYQATPEQTMLVGDTTHDVEAAHGAKLVSVIVKNEHLAHMPEDADYYIDTLPHVLKLLGVSHEDDLFWP